MTSVNPTALTVTVNSTHPGTIDGGVFDFVKPVNDYALTDITELWYAWANYYVNTVFKDFGQPVPASAAYNPPSNTAFPQNEITLTSAPSQALAPGMTVSGTGIRTGTTILSIQDPNGNPIGSADEIGDKIFLSLLPISGQIPASQTYAFGKPPAILYTDPVKPYDLTFDTDERQTLSCLPDLSMR